MNLKVLFNSQHDNNYEVGINKIGLPYLRIGQRAYLSLYGKFFRVFNNKNCKDMISTSEIDIDDLNTVIGYYTKLGYRVFGNLLLYSEIIQAISRYDEYNNSKQYIISINKFVRLLIERSLLKIKYFDILEIIDIIKICSKEKFNISKCKIVKEYIIFDYYNNDIASMYLLYDYVILSSNNYVYWINIPAIWSIKRIGIIWLSLIEYLLNTSSLNIKKIVNGNYLYYIREVLPYSKYGNKLNIYEFYESILLRKYYEWDNMKDVVR